LEILNISLKRDKETALASAPLLTLHLHLLAEGRLPCQIVSRVSGSITPGGAGTRFSYDLTPGGAGTRFSYDLTRLDLT
jgi:hypothetical protein